jgi:ABC-type multidrug transport system fused ATPase/permease subunit
MARRRFDAPDDKDKKKITRQSLLKSARIFRFLLPYKALFFTGFVFLLLSGLTSLTFPFIAGQLVDSVNNILSGWTRSEIAMGMFGVLIFQALFSFLRVELFTRVSEQAMRDIRLAVFKKMMFLPIAFVEKRRVGELTSRLTSDVTQLQDILSFTLAEFVRQITTVLLGIGVIFWVSVKLSVVMLLVFPFIIAGAVIFGKFIRSLSKKVTDDLAAANTVAEETLQSIHTVKAFTNELLETLRYGKSLGDVVIHSLKAARYRGIFISFVILSVFGGITLVLWYGLGLVESGELTVGKLVSFILYTTFIAAAAGGLGDLYGQVQKTIGASERILEILDTEDELQHQQKFSREVKASIAGKIEFSDVHFSYPSRRETGVLKGIGFTIQPGQKIALVGPSGSGKSTIVQLLMRFHDIDKGSLMVDNKPIYDYDIHNLRQHIGIVPQEVILFGGTIEENIRYGKPDASEAELIEAAKHANAWDFISSFPQGLGTIVGERGIKLSGGQKQRIAIARAILKNPAILILDEATSSLDSESEKLVQEALDQLMENRTTLIIAHRLATVKKADRILVIQQGKIIEEGSHLDLLEEENGLYSRLVKMQIDWND